MNRLVLGVLLLPLAAFAADYSSSCASGFEKQVSPGSEIRIRVRSGDTDIVGVDGNRIKVVCEFRKNPDWASQVKIEFREKNGELVIGGGPSNDFHARIEVPRQAHLWVRSPAGDLSVKGIEGNKDIELRAGDLDIEVGNPADYARADASVHAGDLTARAFGVSKGGLFRSFKKENAGGKYRLHAHLGAGDLVLR